jgi:hypothetical protein
MQILRFHPTDEDLSAGTPVPLTPSTTLSSTDPQDASLRMTLAG